MSTKVIQHKDHEHVKLGQWFATAICGNDILSSALYVSGIAIIFAGVFAPIVLAIIGLVLFFYKAVYTEVVEALPINGGAYNCLLNATSKWIAASAGAITILSYMATAVLSGNDAVEYLHTLLKFIPVIPVTICLLLFFTILVIVGVKDSAKVAFGIFSFHIVVLTAFVSLGFYTMFTHHNYLFANFDHTLHTLPNLSSLASALFFGFAASLLGVSGFESSANFVEEQGKGVFRKTLRNMLIGVVIFNPLIALVVLGTLPYDTIVASKDFVLADAARMSGGTIFQTILVIDAFTVLAGAVLTSFVGVSGLMQRMASDGCLPDFLTKQNKRSSYPRIAITFFLLCTSVLLLTNGNLLSLAGVYTIAFLSVMTMFAVGNLILRETRTDLKRTYHAPLIFVLLAMIATMAGIYGNIHIDPHNLDYFLIYFIPTIIVVFGMVFEDDLFKVALRLTEKFPPIYNYIAEHFKDLTEGEFVAFIHHPNKLHDILEYINRNETAWNITLVHCNNSDKHYYDKAYKEIQQILPQLQRAGAYTHFNINLLYKDKPFGPEIIQEISKELHIRKNRILIGSIHEKIHPFEYSDLGGVRIIL